MGDAYKHDPDGVLIVVNSLREKTSGYNEKITQLNNLVNEINDSPLWKDVEIKTSFINTFTSYINVYKNLILALDKYIDYLLKKSESGENIESSYSKV